MRFLPRWTIVPAVMLAATACDRREPARASLRLLQVRPENHVGVFLNEKLQLHFSEPLDPASIHAGSVRITSAAGEPARGQLFVDDESLTFVPAPVLSFELDDGGYLPDTTYFVDLAGFPEIGGLRGRSGAALPRNLRWEFRTVSVAEPRSGFVFEDSSLARGLRMLLRSTVVEPGAPIVLESEEPLDPSTLFSEDFVLHRLLIEQQEDRVRPPISAPIAVRARLSDNRDRNDTSAGGTCLVELTAVDRLLEPGSYWLNIDPGRLRLRDFGGNRVRVWPREAPAIAPLVFKVAERAPGPEESTWFLESFLDVSRRSPRLLEDADGTALWSGSGRVEVRWPAAAGSGADGEVVLAQLEKRSELCATSIEVPAGATCELDSAPGPVVLRAQGKLSIAGQLVRKSRSVESDALLAAEKLLVGDEPGVSTLSECLARVLARKVDVTVLIAGGDLVIDGRIDCDGALFLIAGGRIRPARSDVAAASIVYSLGDVGGVLINRRSTDLDRSGKTSHLEFDPPEFNVLVKPLRWAVESAPLPAEGRAVRWHREPRVGAHLGRGALRVRYRGERLDAHGRSQGEVVVDDPAALFDCPTLRLQVELTLPAKSADSEPWDPPWLDHVLVEFDRTREDR